MKNLLHPELDTLELVSNAINFRPEMQNCLLVAQGELHVHVHRRDTYACVHECVWIHTLEVITPVNAHVCTYIHVVLTSPPT